MRRGRSASECERFETERALLLLLLLIKGELRRLHYDTANATFAPSMAALKKLVPVSQFTYGTDYPYFGFDQINELRKLGLSASDLDAIGHGNAAQFIPRLRA
jgi:predicted TIM-barrel fold metal-dependent hydrolase